MGCPTFTSLFCQENVTPANFAPYVELLFDCFFFPLSFNLFLCCIRISSLRFSILFQIIHPYRGRENFGLCNYQKLAVCIC